MSRKRNKPGARPAPIITELQRAATLQRAGKLAEADALCRKVLGRAPAHAGALNLAGSIAAQGGRWDRAIELIGKAARIEPDNVFVQFNLGRACYRLQRVADARAAMEHALKIDPGFAPAEAELGRILQDAGDRDGAIAAYQRALELDPDQPLVRNSLGNQLRLAGAPAAAVTELRAVIARQPQLGEAQANLALALLELGDLDAAIAAFCEALQSKPDAVEIWHAFAAAVQHLKHAPECEALRDTLLAGYRVEFLNHNQLALISQHVLSNNPELAALLDAADQGAGDRRGLYRPWCEDELLTALLRHAVIRERRFERLLTCVRGQFLRLVDAGSEADLPLPLVLAMASQCFLNEYVWQETEEEAATIAGLESELAQLDSKTLADRPAAVAILACYRPLGHTATGEALVHPVPRILADIVREQVVEPAEERQIMQSIPVLGAIEDEVSRSVRAQYEDNPYPRWKRCNVRRPVPLKVLLRSSLAHLDPSALPDLSQPEILIAGCGTGLQTMRVATTYAGARVLAVDLSLSSLAYSARKTCEYGVDNVEYLHADILGLDALDRSFDVVESFGVLHHMDDPARGLSVLERLLRPGGVMLLGLYSEIARSAVIAAREFVANRGYPATAAGIRQCRQALFDQDPDAACAGVTTPASDFWTLSDTRDLVFHANEHRFTLLQIEAMLDTLALEFLGFELPNTELREAFLRDNPEPRALQSLPAWHAFESAHPDTFGHTYRFWVRKPG